MRSSVSRETSEYRRVGPYRGTTRPMARRCRAPAAQASERSGDDEDRDEGAGSPGARRNPPVAGRLNVLSCFT